MTRPVLQYKLTGFEEFSKTLEELPDRVTKRVTQAAVTKAMRKGVKVLRDAAPRGDVSDPSRISEKFGPLHKNINVKKLRKTRRYEKGARIDTGNAPQGFWYEKGTRNQPARPWFLPAFSGAIGVILETLSAAMGEGIEKEAKKK